MIIKVMELKELKYYMTKEATILKMENEYNKMINKISNTYNNTCIILGILNIVLNITYLFNVGILNHFNSRLNMLMAFAVLLWILLFVLNTPAVFGAFIVKMKYRCVKLIYDKNIENYNMLHNTSDIDASYILLNFSRYAGLIK